MNKQKTLLVATLLLSSTLLSARTWHVSPQGSDVNDGTVEAPVRTISKAAFYAIAGDTVLIQEGIYRERVSPANTGFSDAQRITYMAAPGEEVWLKGSEEVKEWKKVSKGVWKAEIDNALFGDFNPYAINLFGDWLSTGNELHLGEVFLEGKILDETLNPEELTSKQMQWHAEVKDYTTVIQANFGDVNPNKALVEINVRPTCFFPKTTGVNYITVKGLHIAQAATQWSPPTGEQVGIIGPNWSKGWIIEDCEILQSKCVGVCLGKERASGHNISTLYQGKVPYTKHGFSRELEAIFRAYDLGWSKENVGSHLVQNNKIHDCHQAGIVGHLGAAFSTIRNNEIRDINYRTYIGGAETGGIKLHAAIDVIIEHNCIVNTVRGLWLDWQAQGTQVSGNIFSQSRTQDLFIEVSHGPTMVYNNLFLSNQSVYMKAQGVAFFNNLFNGSINGGGSFRYTPYHMPHSTKIKGVHNAEGGDLRFYNNIFLANDQRKNVVNGLATYKAYAATEDSLNLELSDGVGGYLSVKFPLYMDANIYFGELSQPHPHETGYTRLANQQGKATLEERDGKYYLTYQVNQEPLAKVATRRIATPMLGIAIIPEVPFENPDGTPFLLTKDFFGRIRNADAPFVGPFEGAAEELVWEHTSANFK